MLGIPFFLLLAQARYSLVFGRGNGAGLDRFLALGDYAGRGFFNHLLQQQSQMRVWPVICWSDVFDAIGMG